MSSGHAPEEKHKESGAVSRAGQVTDVSREVHLTGWGFLWGCCFFRVWNFFPPELDLYFFFQAFLEGKESVYFF